MVLKFEIDKQLEQKFRETAMRKFGYTKGSLQRASKEALSQWVIQQSTIPKIEDPFSMIKGLLKNLKGKKTSVQLQHEAFQIWAKRYL